MRVSELMTRDVHSVGPDASLDQAMALMEAAIVRHLVVLDGERLVGVLSERDLLEATGWLPHRVREVLEAPEQQVGDLMHSPVVTVSPQDSLVTSCLRMVDWNIGCLPVLEETSLVGLLTERDLLEAYIQATRGDSVSPGLDPCAEEIMTKEFVSAEHDMPAEAALDYCHSSHVRHLPLMKDQELVGMVSDRDLRLSIGRGQLEGTPVGELGSDELVTIAPNARLSSAAEILVRHQIGAVPVVVGTRMIGLISSADVLGHCSRVLAKAHESAKA